MTTARLQRLLEDTKVPKDGFPSSHQLQECWRESLSTSGNTLVVSLLGCEVAGSPMLSYSNSQCLSPCPSNASLQIVSWYWLISFSSFVKSLCACLYKFVYKIKIVMVLPWERFQVLIVCVVVACSFPFLPLLCHYVLLLQIHDNQTNVETGSNLKIHLEPKPKWHILLSVCRFSPAFYTQKRELWME